MVKKFFSILVSVLTGSALTLASAAQGQSLTIATVNNGDMIRMQKLSEHFTAKNPGITLKWITLEENVLRQKVTTDIATKGGQFDILTIGTYEVPIWGKKGWLVPLENLGADYDVDDLLPAIRSGLSVDGKLYAAPFYGESSMVLYRKDLMAKAGLEMPEAPTWDFIAAAARKMTDKANSIYGICLRGKAGWGENMALVTAMANSFGARWFDESWRPQFDQPEWRDTLSFYASLLKDAGPPGAATNGFNENLALFQSGKCGLWIDATSAASFAVDPKKSAIADKVGFALAPDRGLGKRANWLWAWALAIPAGSQKTAAAEKFVAWATSKQYGELVASVDGVASIPPGTRTSLYQRADYKALSFAPLTLASINAADPRHPAVKPVPYLGVQFVAIPEFQGIGALVGQQFSAILTGKTSVETALSNAQSISVREMTKAGYLK